MGKGDGTVTARGVKPGSVVIPVVNGRPQTQFAMRVTRKEGGQVFGVGATAPRGTLAAQEAAIPRGRARFIRFNGTLTGDRYSDEQAINRAAGGRRR